jgi:hypothetical protein
MGAMTPHLHMKHQLTVSRAGRWRPCGTGRSPFLPYLADRGFKTWLFLPGSFYIEMAVCVERELSGLFRASYGM